MENSSSDGQAKSKSQAKPLEISSDPRGFVLLKISGTLAGDEAANSLEATIDDAEKMFGDTFRKDGKKVKIVMDLSQFSGNYDSKAVEIMTRFATDDSPYVEKTACWGGTEKARVAGEIISALAYRNNIKMCQSEAEALAWLGVGEVAALAK